MVCPNTLTLAGLADFSRLESVHGWFQVAAIETDVSETEFSLPQRVISTSSVWTR